jgi:hypothetical protein
MVITDITESVITEAVIIDAVITDGHIMTASLR